MSLRTLLHLSDPFWRKLSTYTSTEGDRTRYSSVNKMNDCRESPASRQIAIACIEHAFSIINSNSMPLRANHDREMERFLQIYADLGGTLAEQSLVNYKNEQWARNRSSSNTNPSPFEMQSSYRPMQSFKSFFSSSHLDVDENYQGVDILLSEVFYGSYFRIMLITTASSRQAPSRISLRCS